MRNNLTAKGLRTVFPLLIFTILMSFAAFSQPAEGCEIPTSYIVPEAAPVIVKTNVVYGRNKTVTGANKVLTMDVYELDGDMREKRPAIIWVHGGAFLFGNRNDMQSFAEAYAALGYVTASIDYRLLPLGLGIPDSTDAFDAAIKAMGDLKAAIRHFRKDAATENRFRIDPDHILIGGLSAGAITALHAAYLDETDAIEPHLLEIIEDNGGFEGSSGDMDNLQYSSEVEAVINLSGAIYREEWINSDEPPLTSFHAKDDDVVPYFDDYATVAGIQIIRLKGTGVIHERAEQIGLKNYFLGLETGGHSALYSDPAYEGARLEYTVNTNLFLREIICALESRSIARATLPEPAVFPNPASDGFTIRWQGEEMQVYAELMDLHGRTLRKEQLIGRGDAYIERGSLAAGFYVVRVVDRAGQPVSAPKRLIYR